MKHLSYASKRTQELVLKPGKPFVELDWTGIDSDMVEISNFNPVLSCGYANCSALALFTDNGYICLSHMLTITTPHQVEEYLQIMTAKTNAVGCVSQSSITAVIIGGSGIELTKRHCASKGINVVQTFQVPLDKKFDVLANPVAKELCVMTDIKEYTWNQSTNTFR